MDNIKFKKQKVSKYWEKGMEGLMDLLESGKNYKNRMVERLEPKEGKIGLSFAFAEDFNCFELAILNAGKKYISSNPLDPNVIVVCRNMDKERVYKEYRKWLEIIKNNKYPKRIRNYDVTEFDKFKFCKIINEKA